MPGWCHGMRQPQLMPAHRWSRHVTVRAGLPDAWVCRPKPNHYLQWFLAQKCGTFGDMCKNVSGRSPVSTLRPSRFFVAAFSFSPSCGVPHWGPSL